MRLRPPASRILLFFVERDYAPRVSGFRLDAGRVRGIAFERQR
ncbi:MAG TPA: hypothetical protein VM364_10045 [Vicinamibacterales bacterium]|nr:hypothetical protein [Vicinamibacterales bacterium]